MIGTAISGLCFLLGACLTQNSLQFRLFSQNATRVEVCLFTEAQHQDPVKCLPLHADRETHIWSLALSEDELKSHGLHNGESKPLYYGYRLWGPNWKYDSNWQPGSDAGFVADVDEHGNRFNPNKLVLDPYALEISHGFESIDDDGSVFESGSLSRLRDSTRIAPKGVIQKRVFEPFKTSRPTRAFKDDVIYEVHVKGLTKHDPSVPLHLRGTYKGAAMKAQYLKDLGVTAIEFLPVHQKVSTRNNPNYWGYMTLGFFAPERSYAYDQSPGGPTREFREMVDEFHRHGIKVYVDVVYNHTGEGGVNGEDPTVGPIYSFRGIDNAVYYELAANKTYYMDNTGLGQNVAAFREPVRTLIMDSLRYWKDVMGVDGYRFDLAPVLGNVPRNGQFFFDAEDPRGVLKRAAAELPARPVQGGEGVDLIAEPWGVGLGTFQQGRFPKGWAEWNAESFRDKVRSFFNKRGVEPVSLGEVAHAATGSSRLFQGGGRKPWSSVNIITSHDGFTLKDLFTYNEKHNNQPWPYGPSDGGENHNRSWDQGGDPVRQRQVARTAMFMTLLSAGVPHITGGDEFLRTIKGNNNPWNLDNIANYLHWDLDADSERFQQFVRHILRFRHQHPVFRPEEFFKGQDVNGNGLKDVTWYSQAGSELRSEQFQESTGFLGYRLDTSEFEQSPVRSIFVALNAGFNPLSVKLPQAAPGHAWHRVADTAAWMEAESNFHPEGQEARLAREYKMHERCALLLIEKPIERKSGGRRKPVRK